MKYDIILADPPWAYRNWSNTESEKRGIRFGRANGRAHFSCLSNEDIYNLPVQDIASDNCALFLWATYPKLPEALEAIKAWGFTFKTVAFTWVKTNKKADSFYYGLGYWTRGNPEICLFATKGHPKRISKSISNLTVEKIGKHSEKPSVIHTKIIDLLGDLSRVELFARKKVEGWTCVGNEIVLPDGSTGEDIRDSIERLKSSCY